ncbi:hypothetical protein [Microtetraspora malaysiensis]|uniref:hypothetical protein n=1 Tax=Microtetraspora malaysiensis TaxID=161358 RepID=UPI003D90A897
MLAVDFAAPGVLVRPGRVAGLLQQMRPYGQQPVVPVYPRSRATAASDDGGKCGGHL